MGNPRREQPTKRDNTWWWLRHQGRGCWICGLPIDYARHHPDPLAFECDELVPVSRGGSPYDHANVDAAHRCCNNWRKVKPVAEVKATRSLLLSLGARWSDPREFIELAKQLRTAPGAALSRPLGKKAGVATTRW